MPIAVAAVMRLCGSRAKRFALEILSAMLFAPSVVLWLKAKCRFVHYVILTLGQSLICRESRTSVVMQFVQFFQVSDCRYLQAIEIIFAGITKIGDVAMEGGTPVIVLADTAVEQQVVPPSERTRAFYDGLRSHGHLPKPEKD
jgi:hypothetical protein